MAILSSATFAFEPLIIAHRGASADAPENTLAAFRLAWEQGADGIEGDFRLCADGHIVCIHDKDTERTGRAKLTVSKSKLADLRALDVGVWKHPDFRKERIATLPEVLAELPDGKLFFVEIKSGAEIMASLRRDISAAIKARPGLASQLVFIAFDKAVVAACRATWPEIKANWLVGFKQDKATRGWSPSAGEVLRTARGAKASGVGVSDVPEVVGDAFVKKLRAAGIEPHCWTVNEAKPARRLRDLGVSSITTDVPAKVRGWVAEP